MERSPEGFDPDLSPEAAHELATLPDAPEDREELRDLRNLLWSDNPDSRDLDPVEAAERLIVVGGRVVGV